MGLWNRFKGGINTIGSTLGIYRSGTSTTISSPKIVYKAPAAKSPSRNDDTIREAVQSMQQGRDAERLMEQADDRDLAEGITKNVYSLPFLTRAGRVGRSAVKAVSTVLTGGSVVRDGPKRRIYTLESSSVPIEARVEQVGHISENVMAYARTVEGTKKPEVARAVAGVLETVKEAGNDCRYVSLFEDLEKRLEVCVENLGGVPASERAPYSKEQLEKMNTAYSTVVSFIWFGKNEAKKIEQAKQALAVYKSLRAGSIDAFNNPVDTRFELETLDDLMKLKEKAIAANKDIETGLYARSVEKEDVRKYAVVAQTLRKHATAMNAEIIKLEKLGDKITPDQQNRKKKVKTVRGSIEQTVKDLGTTMYRALENSKTEINIHSEADQKDYGARRIVYEKAAPFKVRDLVLSPYDQLGKQPWAELANKNLTLRAYTEFSNGVKEKTAMRTKAVELTYKEVLRAYDMAKTITEGIHAAAGIEGRKTNIDDVLNHLLQKTLYQKLNKSQENANGEAAFAAYCRGRQAEKVWRATPAYSLLRMKQRNEARATAEREYAEAAKFAPDVEVYRRAAGQYTQRKAA